MTALGVSLIEGAYPVGMFSDLTHVEALDEWASVFGRFPATYTVWSSWRVAGDGIRGKEFPAASVLDPLVSRGVTPVIFWEPSLDNESESCARIAGGEFDDYIQRWAEDAASWGQRVIVRFAHEQNGWWFPWCPGVNENTDETYIAMWKHVVDIVRATAPDVEMFWCPFAIGRSMALTFPGRTYVDWVGMDAYDPNNTRGPLHERFNKQVQYLKGLRKPIFMGEIGVAATGDGERRLDWLRDTLRGFDDDGVKVVSYFDVDMTVVNGERNWRMRSAPGIGRVYRTLMSKPRFQTTF